MTVIMNNLPSKTERKEQKRADSRATLLALLSPGMTVYTILTVPTTYKGIKKLSFYVVRNNKPTNINNLVSAILGLGQDRDTGAVNVLEAGITESQKKIVFLLASELFGNGNDLEQATLN